VKFDEGGGLCVSQEFHANAGIVQLRFMLAVTEDEECGQQNDLPCRQSEPMKMGWDSSEVYEGSP
jgi:hypothetical protein